MWVYVHHVSAGAHRHRKGPVFLTAEPSLPLTAGHHHFPLNHGKISHLHTARMSFLYLQYYSSLDLNWHQLCFSCMYGKYCLDVDLNQWLKHVLNFLPLLLLLRKNWLVFTSLFEKRFKNTLFNREVVDVQTWVGDRSIKMNQDPYWLQLKIKTALPPASLVCLRSWLRYTLVLTFFVSWISTSVLHELLVFQ